VKARCGLVAQAAEEFPVRALCAAVGVARVSYYRFLQAGKRTPSALDEAIAKVFWEHGRRYGSRRIKAELSGQEIGVGRHRIRRVMTALELHAIQPRSFVPRTTQSRHLLGYSPNLLLELKLPPAAPNEVLVGDITYLPLQGGGWAYLATWTDLFSRRVVGWTVAGHMEESLVIEAFMMVLRRRRLTPATIVHSDRGGQYAGKHFRRLLHMKHLRQSMSRAGETYDNAFAESLFSRYKAELLEGGAFANVEEARAETAHYLDDYYNQVRRHSALGYVSPAEYERNFAAQAANAEEKALDPQPTKGLKPKQLPCFIF
jgi:putative transposase